MEFHFLVALLLISFKPPLSKLDHLKLLHPAVYRHVLSPGERVWFDVYLKRLVAWVLAVVPASVLYASTKLSLLPVLTFKSLDPEHAVHVTFYRPLFQVRARCVFFGFQLECGKILYKPSGAWRLNLAHSNVY